MSSLPPPTKTQQAVAAVVSQNVHLLRQGVEILGHLSAQDYRASPSTSSNGIGSHFRHCLDCYACFLGGLPEGRIDYDSRAREESIEQNVTTAADAAHSCIAKLSSISDQDATRELWVRVDETRDARDQNRPVQWSRSSLGRELKFLVSHTIHHYALIAMILRDLGIELTPDFGVAPSTIRHQQSLRAR